jgi:DNA-binding Xre family transcriptional regulator
MKWNLRLAAANRGIWKASELQRMLAGAGLVISAGKMSGLWSGTPASIKLSDLDVICAVLGCGVADLLITEPAAITRPAGDQQDQHAALAAVHAARPKAIRELHLADIDLGNRRLIISSQARPLDDLTRHLLLAWLQHRRHRWPGTANPHLIINQQTAMTTRAVSENWLTETCRGLTATLERLRADRQLEEALTCGADPLHLAAVFGINDTTAIRYATIARQLLDTPAESTHAGSREPKDQNTP